MCTDGFDKKKMVLILPFSIMTDVCSFTKKIGMGIFILNQVVKKI